MQLFLIVNDTLKGPMMLFQYPCLMQNSLQNDKQFMSFLKPSQILFETKKTFQKEIKYMKKTKYKNGIKDFDLKKVYGNLYDQNVDKFLQENQVLQKIIEKKDDYNTQDLLKKYLEKTELNGTVDKQNCAGFTSKYFINLIHKVQKKEYFRFDVDNCVIIGYKQPIPPSNIKKVQLSIDGDNYFNKDQSKQKNIECFYVCFYLDQTDLSQIEYCQYGLLLLKKLLFDLEMNFQFLSINMQLNYELKTSTKEEFLQNRIRIIQILYINYLKIVQKNDLLNLMTQFCLAFHNKDKFELKACSISPSEFIDFQLRLKNQGTQVDDIDIETKSLIIQDKSDLLKKVKNKTLKKLISLSDPFQSLDSIRQQLNISLEEIQLYVDHLIFWNQAELIETINNNSLLLPNQDYSEFKKIIQEKEAEFKRIFQLNLSEQMLYFFKQREVSFLQYKTDFIKDNIPKIEILIYLFKIQLIKISSTKIYHRKQSQQKFDYNSRQQNMKKSDVLFQYTGYKSQKMLSQQLMDLQQTQNRKQKLFQALENNKIQELNENLFEYIKRQYLMHVYPQKLNNDIIQIQKKQTSQNVLEDRIKLLDYLNTIQDNIELYIDENLRNSEEKSFLQILNLIKQNKKQEQQNSYQSNYEKIKNFSQRKSNACNSIKKNNKKNNQNFKQKFSSKRFDLRNVTNKSRQSYFDTKIQKQTKKQQKNSLRIDESQKLQEESDQQYLEVQVSDINQNKEKDINTFSSIIKNRVMSENKEIEINPRFQQSKITETFIQSQNNSTIQNNNDQFLDNELPQFKEKNQIIQNDNLKKEIPQNEMNIIVDFANLKQEINTNNNQSSKNNKNFEIIRKFSQKQLSQEHKRDQSQNTSNERQKKCSLKTFKSCDRIYFKNLESNPLSYKNKLNTSKAKTDKNKKYKHMPFQKKTKNILSQNKKNQKVVQIDQNNKSQRKSTKKFSNQKNSQRDMIQMNIKINQLKAKIEREAKEKLSKQKKEQEEQYLLYKKEEVIQKVIKRIRHSKYEKIINQRSNKRYINRKN